MCGFLLSKRWIVASVIVLAAVATMVGLGLWQLRRLDQVRSANALVRERLAAAAVPIDDVLGPGSDPARAAYRRVETEGMFDVSSEIVLDNRSRDGRAGKHLLTPLVTAEGKAVVVDRGWIPLDTDPAAARPPSGRQTVVGVLFPSERKGAFGPSLSPSGRLANIPRIDVPRIERQLAYPVYPLYVRLQSQGPGRPGELPLPPGLPALDDGPHLSYAVQWFLFATVALAVFGALARREAKRARLASL